MVEPASTEQSIESRANARYRFEDFSKLPRKLPRLIARCVVLVSLDILLELAVPQSRAGRGHPDPVGCDQGFSTASPLPLT